MLYGGNKGAGSIISLVTIECILCTITKIECQDLLSTMSNTFQEFVILHEINYPFEFGAISVVNEMETILLN